MHNAATTDAVIASKVIGESLHARFRSEITAARPFGTPIGPAAGHPATRHARPDSG